MTGLNRLAWTVMVVSPAEYTSNIVRNTVIEVLT